MAKCWNCGSEGAPDESTSCEPCAEAHQAYIDEMEASYQAAREARIEQNHREWEEWREQQRERRQQERDEWWKNYGLPRRMQLIQERYGRN